MPQGSDGLHLSTSSPVEDKCNRQVQRQGQRDDNKSDIAAGKRSSSSSSSSSLQRQLVEQVRQTDPIYVLFTPDSEDWNVSVSAPPAGTHQLETLIHGVHVCQQYLLHPLFRQDASLRGRALGLLYKSICADLRWQRTSSEQQLVQFLPKKKAQVKKSNKGVVEGAEKRATTPFSHMSEERVAEQLQGEWSLDPAECVTLNYPIGHDDFSLAYLDTGASRRLSAKNAERYDGFLKDFEKKRVQLEQDHQRRKIKRNLQKLRETRRSGGSPWDTARAAEDLQIAEVDQELRNWYVSRQLSDQRVYNGCYCLYNTRSRPESDGMVQDSQPLGISPEIAEGADADPQIVGLLVQIALCQAKLIRIDSPTKNEGDDFKFALAVLFDRLCLYDSWTTSSEREEDSRRASIAVQLEKEWGFNAEGDVECQQYAVKIADESSWSLQRFFADEFKLMASYEKQTYDQLPADVSAAQRAVMAGQLLVRERALQRLEEGSP
ncbi:unnamed protein product [Amoebophrya sp. A25]|nr:unnamed protein product [Amoebophrya sp. A25]|eukprot:GSA25T00007845001.1